jgi:hypothetical protein
VVRECKNLWRIVQRSGVRGRRPKKIVVENIKRARFKWFIIIYGP